MPQNSQNIWRDEGFQHKELDFETNNPDGGNTEIAEKAALLSYLDAYSLSDLQRFVELFESRDLHSQRSYNSYISKLSNRESQVLILVANGYSRGDISYTLDISPNTAARHISNIYRKLDISTVAEATMYAIGAGLVAVRDPSLKLN